MRRKICLEEPSFISSDRHNRGFISSLDAHMTTNVITGNKTFSPSRDQTPGRPAQGFSQAFHLKQVKENKKNPNTNRNAPKIRWFNCCVVDACRMEMKKELQAFGRESFQNPTGNLCWHWGPEVNGKIQTHSSVLWIKPLIQKCVLRGEAPLVHSYKTQNSELLVLIKPDNIFIINSLEQGFHAKFRYF